MAYRMGKWDQVPHKNALVVGGSRGIGRVAAEALLVSGVCTKVGIIGRNTADLHAGMQIYRP